MLVEGLAIFESHKLQGKTKLNEQLFSEYDISPTRLEALYQDYVEQSLKNDTRVKNNRYISCKKLERAGFEVVKPDYSINILFSVPGTQDSYQVFYELLKNCQVSVYPGLLSCIFSKPQVRISPNIEVGQLNEGLKKIINYYC